MSFEANQILWLRRELRRQRAEIRRARRQVELSREAVQRSRALLADLQRPAAMRPGLESGDNDPR